MGSVDQSLQTQKLGLVSRYYVPRSARGQEQVEKKREAFSARSIDFNSRGNTREGTCLWVAGVKQASLQGWFAGLSALQEKVSMPLSLSGYLSLSRFLFSHFESLWGLRGPTKEGLIGPRVKTLIWLAPANPTTDQVCPVIRKVGPSCPWSAPLLSSLPS